MSFDMHIVGQGGREPPDPPAKPTRGPKAIWGEVLGERFCPVSVYFMQNLHRLGGGLTPTQTLVLLQIVSHKWGSDAPYPSLKKIAQRIGKDVRTVRRSVEQLEKLQLLRREHRTFGGTNRYHIDGLIRQLEAIVSEGEAHGQ